VVQPGYASYISHLPAFLKAKNESTVIPLVKQGYTTNYPVDRCIPIPHPPLVVDYNGAPPSKVIEDFNAIGFERIKMQRNDNILRFPTVTLDQVRVIKATNPNLKTPAPANSVNVEAFDTWVLVLRVISNLLVTHVYPAFRDDGHFMEEVENMVENIMISKRRMDELDTEKSKKRKGNDGAVVPDEIDAMETEAEAEPLEPIEIELRKAKPPSSNEAPWGVSDSIPNASGLFFPFIPELASYDDSTVPSLFENHLLASLGNTPEQQIDRLARIKSAWGIISKTETGNIMAHMVKVILLSITSQTRSFPIIQDGIYQGSVLSGGRFFIGLNGQVIRPLTFDKLQEETGSYHLHSRVLKQIAEIATGIEDNGELDSDEQRRLARITHVSTNRQLRSVLMGENLNEGDRDEIKKLAVHLHFKNDSHLPVNPQTVTRVLTQMTVAEDKEDVTLPMHHSALFSRDKVFVSLSAFGFQAPSFSLDNCPKVSISDSKPPSTLVIRQKTLEIATVDWKHMIDSKEIKNNPRNLSRANRDRTITGNDKIVMWKCLKDMCGSNTESSGPSDLNAGFVIDTGDKLDEW
jgi:hypothetical protein